MLDAVAGGLTPDVGGGAVVGAAAVGGAVVGGAAVAGWVGLSGWVRSFESEEHQRQSQAISDLLTSTLGAEGLGPPRGFDLHSPATSAELRTSAPAYPQLKLAFDDILRYQHQRASLVKRVSRTIRTLGDSHEKSDPKTTACEFVKGWLREKAEVREVAIHEVLAYRNFCRGFISLADMFRQGSQAHFIQAMAHTAANLDEILQIRLRSEQGSAQLLERLSGEAHSFMIHALKVPLLAAVEFPEEELFTSLDSLNRLRRTALPPGVFSSEFSRKLAEKVGPAWQKDWGHVVSVLLATPYMLRLCAAREGALAPEELTTQVAILVRSAEKLPNISAMDTVDPFVLLRLTRDGEEIQELRTSHRPNDNNPVWDEAFFLELPTPERADLSLSGMWNVAAAQGICRGGCGGRAAPGFESCCRTCLASGGVKHGPKCGNAHTRARSSLASPAGFNPMPEAARPGGDPRSGVWLHLELADYCEMSGGFIGNTVFARTAPIFADNVLSGALQNHDMRLQLQPVEGGKSPAAKLQHASVTVRLAMPAFASTAAAIRQRWQDGGEAAAPCSGLRYFEVGQMFLAALEALDHLAYFLDIMLGQVAVLARMLGDLGVAIVAPALKALVDEVEHHLSATQDVGSAVVDAVYARKVDRARAQAGKRGGRDDSRYLQEATRCTREFKDLGRRTLATLGDLRRLCARYQDLGVAQADAGEVVRALLASLETGDTARRSGRFSSGAAIAAVRDRLQSGGSPERSDRSSR